MITKEKLLKEKENILKNIETRKDRVAKIDELIKGLENSKREPKYDDTYFYIHADGDIYFDVNIESRFDENLFSIGNYFKTREEAEFEVERLKVLEELKKFSYEFSEEEWKDNDIAKFSMYYDYDYSKIGIRNNTAWKHDLIYFKIREDAQKAIDKIGEERLKKYYFKVGE